MCWSEAVTHLANVVIIMFDHTTLTPDQASTQVLPQAVLASFTLSLAGQVTAR